MSEKEIQAQPVEDLVPYYLDHEYPGRAMLLGSKLRPSIQARLEQLLQEHKDTFACSHENMPEIDLAMMCHLLCLNPKH